MTNTLKPWYAVATPHEDIRKGRLDESVFAANIWAVVQGTAPEVYLDPEEFFRKSYMTTGLSTVLSRVAAALEGGEAGDRIISLQTAFGGGKTHALVALWHLANHADRMGASEAFADVRKALGDRLPDAPRGVAVFTNATCDVTQGRDTPEGVHTRTLWGELALQLGGVPLYDRVRANDEAQRVPQGIFVDVLRAASPCLLLIDELADYCVGAASVLVGDTTLADQTISFIQQLTEAVQQVPGVAVVATLPASRFEVAQSEKGQEAFVTLERRFQRLGADVKPVEDEEIYNVVRARLFENIAPPEESDYPAKVAQAYQQTYASHSGEVPTDAARATYREQMERAYPFHPLVIDTLYTRWGSHPDFQRTRGVLRLLASVVGDLWQRRDSNTQSQPLIQPCHIRWSIDAMRAALTRYWGATYEAVAAADVLGQRSNAGLFDEERGGDYRREKIGEGLASAILLGSFGASGERSGFSSKDLKLACSRPGLNWAYTDGALLELENRCFYLHAAPAGSLGKRYWFATRPTLNKLVVQYRQQAARENFDDQILEALKDQAVRAASPTSTWRVLIDPAKDLPEQTSLALLILPPSLPWNGENGDQDALKQRVMELSAHCGTRDRIYRNTLLFLAPTSRGLSRLRSAHRERAALLGVRSDYGSQLDDTQREDLKGRIETAERAALEAAGPAYTVAIRVANQDLETYELPDARSSFAEHLGYLWTELVENAEWILRRVGSVTLQKTGLIPATDTSRVKDAVEAFLRFTDKPAIASRDAVTEGLAQACSDGLLGIGRGPAPGNLQARYCREYVSLDPTEEGLWIIPPFEPEPEGGEVTPGAGDAVGVGVGEDGAVPTDSEATGVGVGAEAGGGHGTVKRLVIRGSVPQESWADLFRSFVGPAARMRLKNLRLGIQFEMETGPDALLDPEDPAVKNMRESARQLGLEFEAEE